MLSLAKNTVEKEVESSSKTTVVKLMTATLSCNLEMAPSVNDLSAAEILVINTDGLLKYLDCEEAVIKGDHGYLAQ